MKKLKLSMLLFLSLTILLLTGCQSNSVYPNQDVSLLIGFEVGGGIDASGRALFTEIDEMYDIAFVPQNVTGASGTIAATELYNSSPDGYTLMAAGTGLNVAHVASGYEYTYEDFEVVAQYATAEAGLYVSADSPYLTYEDLINAARENPGELKMGVINNTMNHYGSLAIEQHEGVDFKEIVVGGDQPAPPELLAGRIDAYVVGVHQNKAYIESGDFRCLGVFSSQRAESLPDVPTFEELGIMDDYSLSFGVWMPKGTPAEIVEEMSNAVKIALEDEEFIEELKVLGYTAAYQDTIEYTETLRASLDNVTAISGVINAGGDATLLDPYVGPNGFPILIGGLVVLLGICEIIRKLVKKEKFAPKIIELFKGKTLFLLIAMLIYAILFNVLGYVFSTILFMTAAIYGMQKPEDKKKAIMQAAIISVIFTIGTFLFFTYVAGVVIPTSFLGFI